MTDNATKLKTVYEHLWFAHRGEVYEKLDRSLNPRPPEMLYDFVERLNLVANSIVLDVGCGKGNHTCELTRRFNFQAKGIDPVDGNLEIARDAAKKQDLDAQVNFTKGSMESIPFEDATFDLVWCRDMLVHVQDLQRGFVECGRVLKPNGFMVLFTTYATERMEPKEAARLYDALGMVSENLSQSYVEACFKKAGLQTLSSEIIGSELMQYYEERDRRCTRELMRLARMMSAKERFMAELGEVNYEVTSALYRWVIYQLIGKLSSTIYTLRKTAVS
ncbi:MAG: methyltransferase domain-containing protein [Acidobacteriota bacterium]|nr:methyltransferase domain-containing protein [Acidobacteriota bacterium]